MVQGESAAVDQAAEQQAGDLILDALQGIPLTGEQGDFDESAANDAPTDHSPRRRSFFRLGNLLRLRDRR